jgi:hypothetical protein
MHLGEAMDKVRKREYAQGNRILIP